MELCIMYIYIERWTDNGVMYHVYLYRDGQTMELCIMYIQIERWTDNGVMYHVYLYRKMD